VLASTAIKKQRAVRECWALYANESNVWENLLDPKWNSVLVSGHYLQPGWPDWAIFVHWAIVFCGHFLKIREVAQFLGHFLLWKKLCITFYVQKWAGLNFWAIFSHNHLVALFPALANCAIPLCGWWENGHRFQGCQMVYFQTKKSQFGQILEGLR
jgi:hypothetical protein